MAAKLTRLTLKVETQLHLVAECCTICSSRYRQPVRKLLDTAWYSALRNVTASETQMRNEYSIFIVEPDGKVKVTVKLTLCFSWAPSHEGVLGNGGIAPVGKPDGKRKLGTPKRWWENIIKLDLKEMSCEGVNWIQRAHKSAVAVLVNADINCRVPLNVWNFLNSWATVLKCDWSDWS
jgi:hypothetical protein